MQFKDSFGKGWIVPARKSVLLRMEVRSAGKRCTCQHNKNHVILKGEPRFVVQEPGPASREYGYCTACAVEMLDLAADRLAQLRGQVGLTPGSGA